MASKNKRYNSGETTETKISSKSSNSKGNGKKQETNKEQNMKKKKQYKFHDDYLKTVSDAVEEEKSKKKVRKSEVVRRLEKQHPRMEDDGFWEANFGLINFKKLHKEDFDEDEFDDFFDWLLAIRDNDSGNVEGDLEKAKKLLFKGDKKK